MTIEEIRELIRIVNESGIAELELQRGENRVRIRRTQREFRAAFPTTIEAQPPVSAAASATGAPTPPSAPPSTENEQLVKSPIVGTFYESSAPGSPPFVRVGETVQPGAVLCIIESMKLMNEIEAEIAGVVTSKLVANGQPVEYGEALFAIRPLKNILIANRGEIALRVICACKELGIATVAVYSEADRESLHVRFADQAVCIGPAKSAKSYLDIPSVISAAEITNVDAIHPGYGFLSENAGFAEVCHVSGIKFIGPTPDVIRAMGVKDCARGIMRDAGVPILPGSDGVLGTAEEAIETAARIGYPVIVKASAGGGGRGMRIVREPSEMASSFAQAQQEAGAAFSSADVYLEKFIEAPRHIEFQVLADEHGNVEILGERECSIQRRHQKLIEESPSPEVTKELRERISRQLQKAMKTVGYTNAGTVEFLMDESGDLYFIEVNARIQVEHPVTEAVTGIDLVKSQLLIAGGARLTEIIDTPVRFRGHALECRINAENPETFTPSPGRITGLNLPGGIGVRVDTAAYTDCVIPPYYDSLVAKLITYGRDRAEAIARMQRALGMFVVEGIHTSIPLQQKVMHDPDFQAGTFDTNFIKRFMPAERGVKAKV